MDAGWGTIVRDWLERAEEDVAVLSVGLGDDRISDRTFGYHAQQAMEKTLKAMLAAKAVTPPRTHDLRALADMVVRLYALRDDPLGGDDLTPFAIQHRYPGYAPPPGDLDRIGVLDQVRGCLAMASREMGIPGQSS